MIWVASSFVMNTILIPLIQVLYAALNLYWWVIIISVVLSWLVTFNVINTHNRFVHMVGSGLHAVTAPALRRIRRFLPAMSGIDFSPIVLLLIVYFFQQFLIQLLIQLR